MEPCEERTHGNRLAPLVMTIMAKSIDILGLGYAAVDDLLFVDAYPAADTKAPIRHRERQCGGLTATALVAASRMGCHCAYAGTLGENEHSRFVLQRFQEEGIDITHVRRRPDAQPVRSTIIVEQVHQRRTILYDLNGIVGPDQSWPPEDVILNTRVLLIDHCGVEGMIRAAQIARHAGIPVVADLERANDPRFPELLDLVDHLILSHDFALRLTGENHPEAAVRALWSPQRQAAVVTCGKEGCWYVSGEQPTIPHHLPALTVDVLDTTGCGDVFHGAYAAALVDGQQIPQALQFATVAAGLKAMSTGGQAGIPDRAVVETRLKQISCDPVAHRTSIASDLADEPFHGQLGRQTRLE